MRGIEGSEVDLICQFTTTQTLCSPDFWMVVVMLREQQADFLLCNRLPTQTCWWSFCNRWRTKWLLCAVGIKVNLSLPVGRDALAALTRTTESERERCWSDLSLMWVCTPNFLSSLTFEGTINSGTVGCEAGRRQLRSSLLSHYLRLHRCIRTPSNIFIPIKAEVR